MTADVGGSATDAEFAAGFQRDPELFTAVYDKYFRDVYRYVAGRLDNEAADDIAARRKEARHYAALARRAPEPVGYSEENRIVDAVAAGYMRPLLAKALATRGRHQLQQAILRPASRRRAMTGPSRTRRLAAGVGLTAAAAAAAIAALVPGGPLNTAPVRLSARQVLLAAATAAAAQPSSGAYWHVKEVYDFDQPPFGHPRGTWKWTRYTQETWTNRDGAFWVPDSAAGTGVVPLGGPGGFSVASSDLTFNQLQRLPESPAALKAWITHSFEHPAYAQMGIPSASVLPGYVLTTLVRLITDMPVPPAVRAAAFRALASMPNVTSLGPADGGQALLITGPPPPPSSHPGVKLPRGPVPAGDTELIVDPATAQVHSIMTSQSTEAVISEGWTNQMPKVDRVPPKKTDSKGLEPRGSA